MTALRLLSFTFQRNLTGLARCEAGEMAMCFGDEMVGAGGVEGEGNTCTGVVTIGVSACARAAAAAAVPLLARLCWCIFLYSGLSMNTSSTDAEIRSVRDFVVGALSVCEWIGTGTSPSMVDVI